MSFSNLWVRNAALEARSERSEQAPAGREGGGTLGQLSWPPQPGAPT